MIKSIFNFILIFDKNYFFINLNKISFKYTIIEQTVIFALNIKEVESRKYYYDDILSIKIVTI